MGLEATMIMSVLRYRLLSIVQLTKYVSSVDNSEPSRNGDYTSVVLSMFSDLF